MLTSFRRRLRSTWYLVLYCLQEPAAGESMAAIYPGVASRSVRGSRNGDGSVSSDQRRVSQGAVVAPSSDVSAGFPAIDVEGDMDKRLNVPPGGDRDDRGNSDSLFYVDKLLEKVPQSIWQPNAVVQRHRRKATLYWLLLLLGYAVYIGLVSETCPSSPALRHCSITKKCMVMQIRTW